MEKPLSEEELIRAEVLALEQEGKGAPAKVGGAPDGATFVPPQASASPAVAELLEIVFDDVRAQSERGELVEPGRWERKGLVPQGQTAEDWEFFVYDYLLTHAARGSGQVEAATDVAQEPVSQGAVAASGCGGGAKGAANQNAPIVRGASASGGAQATPVQGAADISAVAEVLADDGFADAGIPDVVACDDIVVMVGENGYYLYSDAHMTGTYARWAFLAREDDRIQTFVECVREESRTYPRPMPAASLCNRPFCFARDEVGGVWEAVRASGAYPDIDTVSASNGDVYYFSTQYLTSVYAKSLAEWSSVERYLYL